MDLTTKWLSRSHCLEIFSCLEKIRLSSFCRNMFLSSPSCFFYRSKKVFLKKSHSQKLFSWRKTKLLSPLDFCSIFMLSRNSFLFFSCTFIFFACSFFSGVCFSKQKKVKQISFEKIWVFFSKHFLLNFFWGRNIFWSKKGMCSKLIIRIFLKKKNLS